MAGFCIGGAIPPSAPPPPPPPPATPATIIAALGPYNSGQWPTTTILNTISGVVVGDILVAHMVDWHAISVVTMQGKLPPGFILVREDINPGLPNNISPLYSGIAIKTAVAFDTQFNPTAYQFTNPGSAQGGQFLGVAMTAVHGSAGLDFTSYTFVLGGGPATTTLAGVRTSQPNELILVLGAAGTDAGAVYICAGNSAATVGTNDIPPATLQGNSDSADRIWSFSAGPAGTSPTHNVTTIDPNNPVSGYLVSMLGM